MIAFLWFAWSTLADKRLWYEARMSMVAILICCLFIDIATSSKVMTIFWIMIGMSAAERAGFLPFTATHLVDNPIG